MCSDQRSLFSLPESPQNMLCPFMNSPALIIYFLHFDVLVKHKSKNQAHFIYIWI